MTNLIVQKNPFLEWEKLSSVATSKKIVSPSPSRRKNEEILLNNFLKNREYTKFLNRMLKNESFDYSLVNINTNYLFEHINELQIKLQFKSNGIHQYGLRNEYADLESKKYFPNDIRRKIESNERDLYEQKMEEQLSIVADDQPEPIYEQDSFWEKMKRLLYLYRLGLLSFLLLLLLLVLILKFLSYFKRMEELKTLYTELLTKYNTMGGQNVHMESQILDLAKELNEKACPGLEEKKAVREALKNFYELAQRAVDQLPECKKIVTRLVNKLQDADKSFRFLLDTNEDED